MRGGDAGEYVVRFSYWQRFQHAMVILLFGVLLLTGIVAVRWLHRAAGIAFSLLLLAHLAVAIGGVLSGRTRPSMLLSVRDFRDAVDFLRYCVGWAEAPPRFGRYDYRQKFEYWGLVFGGFVMALTGFILYFPITVSRLLPAELIPAAKVMHSYEALLAFLIILVWHLFAVLASPETFPMDTSIFTGKIRKDRLRHEHPLEYDELDERE